MKRRNIVILVVGVPLAIMLLFFALPFAKQRSHSLLCKAAVHGDISMVKACLMVRPDLNKHPTDGDGFTGFLALECAAIGGNADIVMLLLQNGSNPNPPGPNPLITACSLGHSKVAKLLLDHGADPNANGSNCGDGTPLSAATGHPEIIKLLRSYGAKE